MGLSVSPPKGVFDLLYNFPYIPLPLYYIWGYRNCHPLPPGYRISFKGGIFVGIWGTDRRMNCRSTTTGSDAASSGCGRRRSRRRESGATIGALAASPLRGGRRGWSDDNRAGRGVSSARGTSGAVAATIAALATSPDRRAGIAGPARRTTQPAFWSRP